MFRSLAAGLAALLLLASPLSGQKFSRFGVTVPDVREVTEEEGRRLIEGFRTRRPVETTRLRFELEHLPRLGEERRFTGTIEVVPSPAGGAALVTCQPESGDTGPVSFCFTLGPSGDAWQRMPDGEWARMDRDSLLAPILPGLQLAAQDLLAPWLYWDTYSYLGSDRVSGAPVQVFRFEPPAGYREAMARMGAAAVNVAFDNRFDVPLLVEYVSPDGEVLREIEARGFKKFNGRWMVRRVDGFEAESRDRTLFRVLEADFGVLVENSWPTGGEALRPGDQTPMPDPATQP